MNLIDGLLFISVLTACISVFIIARELYRYKGFKPVYNPLNAKKKMRSELSKKIYFSSPETGSKKYNSIKTMLSLAGFDISVERLYVIKLILTVFTVLFFTTVNITDYKLDSNNIINDPNFKKATVTNLSKKSELVENEIAIYNHLSNEISIATLGKGKKLATEFIKQSIIKSRLSYTENLEMISLRMYHKLMAIRRLESEFYSSLPMLFMLALFFFYLPEIVLKAMILFVRTNKSFEIITYMIIYSIFAKPDRNPMIIIDNMVTVAGLYKPILVNIQEHIKYGRAEKGFKDALYLVKNDKQFKNHRMYSLIERLRDAIISGTSSTYDMDIVIRASIERYKISSDTRRSFKFAVLLLPYTYIGIKSFEYLMLGISNLLQASSSINF